MSVQLIDRELDRLENLWEDGLSDTYRSYLEAVAAHEPAAQPKLALAAALVEIGIRLQGLGGRAASPPSLLQPTRTLAAPPSAYRATPASCPPRAACPARRRPRYPRGRTYSLPRSGLPK